MNQKTLSLNFKSSCSQMFYKIGVLKGTIMQIGKALVNDRLRVSKVS